MESPVEVETEKIYPVANYGSALAPFYSNLAIWVGGIVLIAIFKLEVDEDETLKTSHPHEPTLADGSCISRLAFCRVWWYASETCS